MFKIHSKSFINILWIQFLNILRPINLVFIISIPLVFLLPAIISSPHTTLSSTLTWGMPSFACAIMLWKVLSDIFSIEYVDKNRIIFLTNNKYIVNLARIVANTIIFIVPFLLYIIGGALLGINSDAPSYPVTISRLFVFLTSTIILYIFITLTIQYTYTLKIKKWFRITMLSIFILAILFFYFVIPRIILPILQNNAFERAFDPWSNHNNPWTYYVPFLNMTYIYQMFNASYVEWVVTPAIRLVMFIPFILETVLFNTILYFLMAKNIKEYLCT